MKRPRTTKKPRPKARRARRSSPRVAEADAGTLRAVRRQIERNARSAPLRWNPDEEDVRRSVVKLVLTITELIRKLMERQAVRRMDARTLTSEQTEAVGAALMELERTIRDIAREFGLAPEDLNLDLGAIKLL